MTEGNAHHSSCDDVVTVNGDVGDTAEKVTLLPVMSSKVQQSQPHFTKLTLPPKYEDLPLVTRLWLQSRISGFSGKTKASDPAGSASEKAATGNVTLQKVPLFNKAGRRRPINLANLWIWLDLARALTPYLRTVLRHAHPIRLAIYVLKMTIDTLKPTAKLYAQSQLYDLVERAIGGEPAPWATALRLGSSGLMIRVMDIMMESFFAKNSDALHNWIEYVLEKAYLTMQLDIPLNSTDELELSQVFEAGVFAGIEYGENYNEGPWGLINGLGGAFAKSVDITAKVAMLINALGGIGQLKNLRDGKKGTQTAVLLLLAFAPTILHQLREKAHHVFSWRYYSSDDCNGGVDPEGQLADICDIATSGHYKQEVVLFGLRDWVLKKWDAARALVKAQEQETPQSGTWIQPLYSCCEDLLRTIFYVLLATKTIDTGLTLGSIHLYQNTTSEMIWSVRTLNRNFDLAWQSVFYAAAFVGALEPSSRGPMIDYDTVRVPGGMRIVARNLSFTYNGAKEPTLSDVNLVVERGETLAIVGYNGGGKTTLVKVLMGLYVPDDNGGQVMINDIPAAHFDSATVYRRQSALFQDFAKYHFTLKENVGVGNVSQADNMEAINAAIDAGGAQGIRDKFGLDCPVPLDPWGEPKSYKSKAIHWYDSDNESEASDNDGEDDSDSDNDNNSGSDNGSHDKQSNDTSSALLGEAASDTGGGTPTAPETGSSTPNKKKNYPDCTALSGGQWQRIGLARAFMRAGQADLVVFDEPSAALDPRAEAELFANIHGLSHAAGSTTIYISHRFNTVRKADKIALVDGGKIVEFGNHAELMALKGQYYDLFTTQAEGYLD